MWKLPIETDEKNIIILVMKTITKSILRMFWNYYCCYCTIIIVQLLSRVWLFVTPWTSLSSGVCANSYPLIWWCHPTISFSVAPFSSYPQSFPALGSFPMSWFLTSAGQSIGTSVSTSVLPMNIQGWFLVGLTDSPGKNTGVGWRSPGDLPNPGIKLRCHTLQADSLPSEPPGKPPNYC